MKTFNREGADKKWNGPIAMGKHILFKVFTKSCHIL